MDIHINGPEEKWLLHLEVFSFKHKGERVAYHRPFIINMQIATGGGLGSLKWKAGGAWTNN